MAVFMNYEHLFWANSVKLLSVSMQAFLLLMYLELARLSVCLLFSFLQKMRFSEEMGEI